MKEKTEEGRDREVKDNQIKELMDAERNLEQEIEQEQAHLQQVEENNEQLKLSLQEQDAAAASLNAEI